MKKTTTENNEAHTIKVTSKIPIRINIFLRDAGIGSRRKIDEYIQNKFVTINNKVAVLGSKVKTGDIVSVSSPDKELIYALYNKPRGEVTGENKILKDALPVGRLDKESEGLLLYTNDFRVVDALLNPKYGREKEYEVTIREKATPRVVTLLKKGIYTQEGTFAPVKSVSIYKEGYSLRIILTEGKKHEIRRMLNALNLTVMRLIRVRILSFTVRGLGNGEMHKLNEKQIETLLKECGIKN